MKRASFAQRGAAYFEMSGPGEFVAAAILFVLMIVIRIINIRHHEFDSDEPQHLHVIWGWARGFVQYRDLFDNHMPLFHILFAPIFGLIGERATIVYVMRFILLPLYFAAAWCTYQIGTSLFSRRAGVWAVILAGLYARYHFVSVEFRPDNLWALFWLMCIAVLVTGPLTVRRAIAAGLLLGFCFGVSIKSVLLLFSIALAAPITLHLVGRQRLRQSWSNLTQCAAAFLISASIVPGIVIVAFALGGAWRDFRYCLFDFNFLARDAYKTSLADKIHLALAVVIVPLVIGYGVRWIMRASENPGLAFRRGFVLIVCGLYFLTLKFLSPVIRHDNDPPFYPLAAILCSGGLLAFSNALVGFRPNRIFALVPLPAFVALAEIVVLVAMEPIWKDRTKQETDLLRDVLTLVQPSDYVLDSKGETVFRRRCVRPVFETITQAAIRRGIIVNDAPQRCVKTHTCVVATTLIKKLPQDTRRFVKRNYLPVTKNLRVAGEELKPSSTNPGRYEFEVTIPAFYEIISPGEGISGILDDVPYNGARFLTAGPHTFEATSSPGDLFLLWAQAADRHFTPFEHHASPSG